MRAQRFKPGVPRFIAQPLRIGSSGRRVQVDQDLTCLDLLSIPHMDRLDHGGFHRLDDLCAVVGDDLAYRGGYHVDAAEHSPQQRD